MAFDAPEGWILDNTEDAHPPLWWKRFGPEGGDGWSVEIITEQGACTCHMRKRHGARLSCGASFACVNAVEGMRMVDAYWDAASGQGNLSWMDGLRNMSFFAPDNTVTLEFRDGFHGAEACLSWTSKQMRDRHERGR